MRTHALLDSWNSADVDEACRLRDLPSPLQDALLKESKPAALSMASLCEAELRLPLTRATKPTCDQRTKIIPPILLAEGEAARRPRFTLVL